MAMPRVVCELCGRVVAPHGHYVVRIDVFADPAMPAVSGEEMEEADYEAQVAELLNEMEGMTEEELQDGVARRFEYRICRGCQAEFLRNPLGLPRGRRDGRGEN